MTSKHTNTSKMPTTIRHFFRDGLACLVTLPPTVAYWSGVYHIDGTGQFDSLCMAFVSHKRKESVMSESEVGRLLDDDEPFTEQDWQDVFDRMPFYEDVSISGEGQLVLDRDMGLETLWLWGMVLSFLALLAGGFMWWEESAEYWWFVVGGGGGFAVFLALKLMTDNYYVLDFDQRRLLYNGKFLGLKRISKVCSFSSLAGVVVESKKQHGDSGAYWEYWVSLVTKEGKAIVVSETQADPEMVNAFALDVSVLLGVDLAEAMFEYVTKWSVNRDTGELEWEHVLPPGVSLKRIVNGVLLTLVVLGLLWTVAMFLSR
jgi:hypothetical protein